MADTLKFKKGTEAKLPSVSNGQILFTTDTHKLYVDDGGNHHLVAGEAIKSISRSGTTFTVTKLDGTTDTFTQQDNNTTYSAGGGLSLSGTTFSNAGVRSVATGGADGTISVNTNGTAADVAVKGLGSAAYRDIRSGNAVTHTNFGTNNSNVPDMTFLAYWNGAYSSNGASNLDYCAKGAFGSIVTKNAGDYLPINGTAASAMMLTNNSTTLRINKNMTAFLYLEQDGIVNWGIERDSTNKQMLEHYYDSNGNYTDSFIGLNSNNYNQYAFPLSGGQLNGGLTPGGDITFNSIGNGTVSNKIIWNGSTDGADIYYRTDAADAGRLVLNLRDDDNTYICFAKNGTDFATLSTTGYFSGSCASAVNADTVDGHHFHWSGQGGQPTWVWGGNDSGNMYVYNPSNFSVNYANSAGSSSWASGATYSDRIQVNNTAGLSGCLQYVQTSEQTSGYDNPSSGWWHVIKMNHGTGDDYYKRLFALDFHTNRIMTTYKNGGGTDHTTRWVQVWVQGDSVTGAVWNDYAEARESDCEEPGYVVIENGNDTLSKSTERLQQFAGIVSDTWGFSQGETEKAKTHIAVAGRVLAYPYQNRNNYKPGDAVCTAPGGTVDIMTDEEIIKYPHRIVGTVSCVPDYDIWGGGETADRDPVKVNGRIWIKVR